MYIGGYSHLFVGGRGKNKDFFRNSSKNKEFWERIPVCGLYFGNCELVNGEEKRGSYQLGPKKNKDYLSEYLPIDMYV